MKKNYEKPEAERIEFKYRDQVVVASACKVVYVNTAPSGSYKCQDNNTQIEYTQTI